MYELNCCPDCWVCGENRQCCIGIPGPRGPRGLQGPKGDPGTGGGSALIAYGGLCNASSQLVGITQANAYVQINLNRQLPMKNVTASGNALVISEEGDYEINYNVLVNTSKAAEISVAVRNAGTVITDTRTVQSMAIDNTTTISYDARMSASTLVHLYSGDTLDIAISVLNSLPQNLDMIIGGNANAALTVKKLDGPTVE